jgi:hypothetical protein
MESDAEMLAAVPDFVTSGLLKASPKTEGGRRILYMEASNEGLDQQSETVAAKALAESADYYKKYGNVDIDHVTMIGPKLGIPDHQAYEIGRPLDVGQRDGKTFVKAEIFRGEGVAATKANHFWSSITEIDPPQRWYPSVAGSVLEKAVEVGQGGMRKAIIKRVRWSNIGMSRTPVNQHVPVCATVPMGIFAKALAAGYGTDSAALEGGGALRKQSLEGAPANYFDFRHRLSRMLRKGECGPNPGAHALIDHSVKHFGLSPSEATEHVGRFMRDLRRAISKRK